MKQEDKAGKISFKTKGDALRCTGSCDLLDSSRMSSLTFSKY